MKEQECEKLLKRTQKRLDKIIKQSDKQQILLMKLNEQLDLKEKELRKLYDYDKQQQLIAKNKLDNNIVNDLKDSTKIIYQAADILSGDFYSIHKLKNGAILAYIIDGQGHGIPPSLTVFAISSAIQHLIEDDLDFEEIIEQLFQRIKKFLGDAEQLSYTFVYLNDDIIKYASGGMYPFLVKNGDEIVKYKANNMPFMCFYKDTPNIKTISTAYESIVMYSDGLIEDSDEEMVKFRPKNLLQNPDLFERLKKKLNTKKFEDDITVIKIENFLKFS